MVSKGVLTLAVGVIVLAGCLQAATVPAGPIPPSPLPPLPPPKSANLGDNLGSGVLQDPEFANATTGPLPWRNECIRQWSSQAYDYGAPPLVNDKPCRFFPTAQGTMYWAAIDAKDKHISRGNISTVRAAPLARQDGFFDWVYLAPETHDLYYLENGSSTPSLIAKDLPIVMKDEVRDEAISAVRTNDGTIHVGLHDRGDSGSSLAGEKLHHIWWGGDLKPHVESLEGGGWFDVPALRSDGIHVAGYAPTLFQDSRVYVASTGAFQTYVVPGVVYDLAMGPAEIDACVGLGGIWYVWQLKLGEGVAVPTLLPVTASPVAAISFYCSITVTKAGPVLVFPGGPAPLIGGGPNPFAASAVVATPGVVGWTLSSLDWDSGYGEEDLGLWHGIPVFMAETGNGTGSETPQDGTELRMPVDGHTDHAWGKVWGNFARTAWFVDDPVKGRLLLLSEEMDNPPFKFPHPWGTTSWGVVDVTLTAPTA